MIAKCYLQIGKKGHNHYTFKANNSADTIPLRSTDKKRYYPTIQIALNIELPDDAFDLISKEINLKIDQVIPAVEIKTEVAQEVVQPITTEPPKEATINLIDEPEILLKPLEIKTEAEQSNEVH